MARSKSRHAQRIKLEKSSDSDERTANMTAALKRTERKLGATKDALRRYEGIVSTSKDFIAFVDADYRYQAISPSYLEAFGKPKEEIRGRSRSRGI